MCSKKVRRIMNLANYRRKQAWPLSPFGRDQLMRSHKA